MRKFLLLAGLIFGLTGNTFAQLSAPKVEAVYGGSINAITAVPLSSTQTRVIISTESANSMFYGDMTTGGSGVPSFGKFTVMPGAGAANGFGSNITQIAVHRATGDIYFVSNEGALVKTNPSGNGPTTVVNSGVTTVSIVNASDSLSYAFYTDPTGLNYGTLDSTGNFTMGANSPLKLNTNINYSTGPVWPEICPDPVNRHLYYTTLSSSPVLYATSDPYDSFSVSTTFSKVNTAPLSTGSVQWTAFAVGNDGTLFFGGTGNFEKMIAYSKDGGNTWTIDTTGYSGMGGPDISFTKGDTGYTVCFSTLYASFDSSSGFSSWNKLGHQASETNPNDGSVLVDPLNDSVVYTVTDQGLGVSVNGGSVIKEIDGGITALQVNGLDLDSTKSDGWIASKAGIRHVTNYSTSPVWSVAMFPMHDGSPYYSVAMVGNNPSSVYAGNSRVYKTTDAGSTWTMVLDAENPPYNFNSTTSPVAVAAIKVNPYDTNMVMAGYAPENASFDSSQGGVFYSTDAGATWTQLLCLAGTQGTDISATSIVFRREQDSTVAYIGAAYNPYFPDSTMRGNGVYRAVWNGTSWTARQDMSSAHTSSGKDIPASISALALSSTGDTLYAAGSDESGANPKVYFKALNGTSLWTELSAAGLPGGMPNVQTPNNIKAMAFGRDTLYCAIGSEVFLRDISSDTSWTLGYSYPPGDEVNVLYYDDLLVGTGTGLYGQHISGSATFVEGNPNVPGGFALHQNYPNPFNPTTEISYSVPANAKVTLKVYDILGQEVATLVNRVEAVGRHEVRFDGSRFASGVYFYRLKCGSFTSVKKMILIK